MKWNDVLENAIVGAAVAALVDDGFRVEMSDQDGGGMFAYAWKTAKRPAGGFAFWIKFVPGNGVDVLSDYTTNLEAVLKEVNAFAAQYA